MRIGLISAMIGIFCALTCYAEPETNTFALKEGDMLVYKHMVVDQGLADGDKLPFIPANTLIEIGEVYAYRTTLKVGKARWEDIEKVTSIDKGLKYGFPLKVGMEWDSECDFKRNDHMYCQYVEKVEDVTVPAGTFRNCFKIAHKTIPDEEIEWYYPGVGIVKYEYHHHGTITDEIYELKQIVNSSLPVQRTLN